MATQGGPGMNVVVDPGVRKVGGPALPVAVMPAGYPVTGDNANLVYVVTSGPVQGGPAVPVVQAPAGSRCEGGAAIPVYVVSGSLSGSGTQPRTLVFFDEFNGGALDLAKWVAIPPGNGNGANGYEATELQANIASTITEGGGNLTVTATKVNPPGPQVLGMDYTSGCPSTYGIFAKAYGRFEIRAKVPNGGGQWPAFWLYPADPTLNQSAVLVPEIDVFEFFTGDKLVHCNYFDAEHVTHQSAINLGDMSLAFHTYAVEWSVDKVEWFVDDVSVYSTTIKIASQLMYVIMQFSLGGGGGPINDAALPSQFIMDYVRVYETLDPFHPGQIAGLQLWYEAERLKHWTTYYDPAGTDLTDNTALFRWIDRAGWGANRSPIQGNGAQQPIFHTGGPNGLAYVHFDGSDDFMADTAATWPLHIGAGSFAFGAVVRCDNVSGAGVYRCIFDYGQNGINSPGFYILNTKPTVSTGNADFIFATTLASSTWYFLYFQRDGATNDLNCWVNGVQDANTLTFNRNVPDLAYEIGNDHTTNWFNGDIAEIIFYNSLPSAAERAKLFAYYSTKYAL